MNLSLSITVGLNGSENADRPVEMKDEDEDKEHGGPKEDSSVPEGAEADQDFNLSEVIDPIANTFPHGM